MRKSLSILPPLTLLLLGINAAQAASNAQMTITANVVAATCDVTVSNPNLDLGNYTKNQFPSTVATPVNASLKAFTVGLSNCETPLKTGDTASLVVTGQTLGGNPNIFNSTGTNTGVMISKASSPEKYINSGDKLQVSSATSDSLNSADFNGKTLTLQAGLASVSTTPDIGMVSAPILFSFAYN